MYSADCSSWQKVKILDKTRFRNYYNFKYASDGVCDGAYFLPNQLWGILEGATKNIDCTLVNPHLPNNPAPTTNIPQVDGAICSSSPSQTSSSPQSPPHTPSCIPFQTRIFTRTRELFFRDTPLRRRQSPEFELNQPEPESPRSSSNTTEKVFTSPQADNYLDDDFNDQENIRGFQSLQNSVHVLNDIYMDSDHPAPLVPISVSGVPLGQRCDLTHVLRPTLPLAPEAVVTSRVQDLTIALSPMTPMVPEVVDTSRGQDLTLVVPLPGSTGPTPQ